MEEDRCCGEAGSVLDWIVPRFVLFQVRYSNNSLLSTTFCQFNQFQISFKLSLICFDSISLMIT